jgi:hypothetical protein
MIWTSRGVGAVNGDSYLAAVSSRISPAKITISCIAD